MLAYDTSFGHMMGLGELKASERVDSDWKIIKLTINWMTAMIVMKVAGSWALREQ